MLPRIEARRFEDFHFTVEQAKEGSWPVRSWGMTAMRAGPPPFYPSRRWQGAPAASRPLPFSSRSQLPWAKAAFSASPNPDSAKNLRASRNVRPQEAAQRPSSENRRALLAEIGFLAADRNEWTQDGKNYVNGLFKMLHTEGSHPGLSDEDHSTFRLHVVLVTVRTFLRRLTYGR
ncbi:hypothetical protein NKG60_14615 [Mesorhizobium sp. M1428]|uniref:hypothetical protein n=1 Tax=Mesorhizobium sp. M1428 TaxID=2957102 RepID=UPI00333AE03E